MARPSAMSDEAIIALCVEIDLRHISVAEAAERAGVSVRTISTWRRKYEAEVVDRMQMQRLDVATQSEAELLDVAPVLDAAADSSDEPDLVHKPADKLREENRRLRSENDRLRGILMDPTSQHLMRLTQENELLRESVVDLVVELRRTKAKLGAKR